MGVFDFEKGAGGGPEEKKLTTAYRNNTSLVMTIPADVRDDLGIDDGDKLVLEPNESGFEVRTIQL